MNGLARTPMKDLAEAARKHYEEASLSVCHWSSTIPRAIEAWERQEQANKRLHLRRGDGRLICLFPLAAAGEPRAVR